MILFNILKVYKKKEKFLVELKKLDKTYPIGVYYVEKQYTPIGYVAFAINCLEMRMIMSEIKEECCCNRTKERSDKEYQDLIHRLNRIEGQIRGIRGMVERNAYCTDILTQVAAANAALNSFNKTLLSNHIKTCVTRDIKEGKEETVDELIHMLQKLMK